MSNLRSKGNAHRLFRGLGEPLLGLMDDEEILGLIAGAGFAASHHTGMREWARTAGWWPPRVVIEERVLVAANAQDG
jgi:hypothetical protein